MNEIEQNLKKLKFPSLESAEAQGYQKRMQVPIDVESFEEVLTIKDVKLLRLREYCCPLDKYFLFFPNEDPPQEFIHKKPDTGEKVVVWWQYGDE